MNDGSKPLRSKLLAVPSLRAKYLECVRTIAEKQLDWKQLGPIVAKYESLIGKEVEADTRKLTSYAAFKQAVADGPPAERALGWRGDDSLFTFAKERRKFLLEYKEPVGTARP